MNEQDSVATDAEFYDITPAQIGRRGDGGIYLVVADNTEESSLALHYAARLAKSNRGHLAVLSVIDIDKAQEWGTVEDMMRHELREQAEKHIWSVARKVNELNGLIPSLYIQEGSLDDVLIHVIDQDSSIRMLVLGGGAGSGGPGRLVGYFTGKGLARLRIPVLVVPGHLDQQKIDAIT